MNTKITIVAMPITKLNKVLDEAKEEIKGLKRFKDIKSAEEYIKDKKEELLNILNKKYKSYLSSFKGYKISVLIGNKAKVSFTINRI